MATSNTALANQLAKNLEIWKTYISNTNDVANNFQTKMNYVQTQIDNANYAIDGVEYEIQTTKSNYIKSSQTSIDIKSDLVNTYTEIINIFTDSSTINVTSSVSGAGIYIDGKEIQKDDNFYTVTNTNGFRKGYQFELSTQNAKVLKGLILKFNNGKTGSGKKECEVNINITACNLRTETPILPITTNTRTLATIKAAANLQTKVSLSEAIKEFNKLK